MGLAVDLIDLESVLLQLQRVLASLRQRFWAEMGDLGQDQGLVFWIIDGAHLDISQFRRVELPLVSALWLERTPLIGPVTTRTPFAKTDFSYKFVACVRCANRNSSNRLSLVCVSYLTLGDHRAGFSRVRSLSAGF